MQTKTLKITAIGRAPNSTNGNPRFDLEFEDGSTYRTEADNSYAVDIGNPGYREGDRVTITLTNHKHPKISKIERATDERPTLTFTQHSKQPYSHIPLANGAVDDFIVSNGNCEFRLEVHALGDGMGRNGRDLSIRLGAFGDGTLALREALDMGILDVIGDIKPVGRGWPSADVLAVRLTELGIEPVIHAKAA